MKISDIGSQEDNGRVDDVIAHSPRVLSEPGVHIRQTTLPGSHEEGELQPPEDLMTSGGEGPPEDLMTPGGEGPPEDLTAPGGE